MSEKIFTLVTFDCRCEPGTLFKRGKKCGCHGPLRDWAPTTWCTVQGPYVEVVEKLGSKYPRVTSSMFNVWPADANRATYDTFYPGPKTWAIVGYLYGVFPAELYEAFMRDEINKETILDPTFDQQDVRHLLDTAIGIKKEKLQQSILDEALNYTRQVNNNSQLQAIAKILPENRRECYLMSVPSL